MRVWNTRPDAQKLPTKSVNPISEMIMNKITEYTSDHQTLGSHEQNPHQLKQLNKKVFRIRNRLLFCCIILATTYARGRNDEKRCPEKKHRRPCQAIKKPTNKCTAHLFTCFIACYFASSVNYTQFNSSTKIKQNYT